MINFVLIIKTEEKVGQKIIATKEQIWNCLSRVKSSSLVRCQVTTKSKKTKFNVSKFT